MNAFENEIINKLDKIILHRLNIKVNESNEKIYNDFTNHLSIELIEDKEKNLIFFKHSIKFANISFDCKSIIGFLTENALALGMSWESLNPWKIVLLIICDVCELASKMLIKLDDNMVKVVNFLHENNGYIGIDKDEFLKKFVAQMDLSIIESCLKELSKIKVLKEENGKIFLKEKVVFKYKNLNN